MKRETLKSKWFEGHGLMYYESDVSGLRQRLEFLQDEINESRNKDFHQTAYLDTIHNWIKSDSVYTLLRYGSKSTIIIDGMDDFYIDMLNLSEELRAADRADIENRNDAYDQKLP